MKRQKRSTSPLQGAAVFTISLLFVMTALVGLYKCFSQAPQVPAGKLPSANTGTTVDPQELDGLQSTARETKEGFYTILVSGLDNDNGGSDTNLLVALDTKNSHISVISLPRDTLLNVSWSVKKLNNAYHHGGISRTIEEVSDLLGIPVQFYVTVDLEAFVALVDELGGVDFDIPLDMDYDDPYQDLHIHLPAGPRHLDGQETMQVVRWRKNNDGSGYATADIGRISTQQAFLKALAQQTLQLSNLDKLPALAEIFKDNVTTDLKLANLIWIGQQALSIGSEGISFHTLPGDGAGYYKGVSYYTVEPEATLELVNTYCNPYVQDLTLDDMDILVP